MSIYTEYRAKYKKNLIRLTQSWAKFRKLRIPDELKLFHKECAFILHDTSAFELAALHQVISSMKEIAEEGLENKKQSKQVILEIDWLINQLIRGNQEDNDPFLLATPQQDVNQNIVTSMKSHTSVIERATKPNIVIIDDQKSVGLALIKMLEDFSFHARYFESISEFKEAVKAHEVDLVLLDVVMPGVTQEAVFEFANELQHSGIKVMCCSSTFTFDVRLLAVRAKVVDYIVKPVNTYILVEKIGRALGLQSQSSYNIVIVDDQESMGTFYKAVLEQAGCTVKFYSSARELFTNLDDLSPDIFLLDLMMPDVDGLEVAKMIRQEHKFDFAPILFITADEQDISRLKAIDAGADDVINKTTSIQSITKQLLMRLERASKVKAFVAKDPLTGVLNHGQIVELANQAIHSQHRRKSNSALAIIDVDLFKKVNDLHGHIMGDKVLCALGQLLSNSVRETDRVGRYGGEEFVIVFEDCSLTDAAKKVQAIKQTFSKLKFGNEPNRFSVSFSAGLVDLQFYEAVQPAIATADKALYKAKMSGRNRVVIYNSQDADNADGTMRIS